MEDHEKSLREYLVGRTLQHIEFFEDSCNACYIKFIKSILNCLTQWNSMYDMIMNELFFKSVSYIFLIFDVAKLKNGTEYIRRKSYIFGSML